ncbi:MAG: GspE/PulE family protein [Patescibacteria group bacterium]
MINVDILKKIIKNKKILDEAGLRVAIKTAEKAHLPLESYLISKNIVDETTLYQAIANHFDLPFIDLKNREIKQEVISLIPSPLAVARQVVIFAKDGKELKAAVLDPLDLQTMEFIKRKTGLAVKAHLTTPGSLKEVLRKYHASLESELQIIKSEEAGDEKQLKKIAEDLPIINIVNSILEHAVFEKASDIHIEPMEKEMIVRYRIDGVLRQVMTLPKAVQAGIIARIKILANLKLDEHQQPQDGRIKIEIQDEKLSLRVSILPVYDGEKIVMRLLPESTKPLTLDQLGFLPDDKKRIEDAINKPHGMVLVTGPTGSGKTTTLYSVLNILNQPGVNIVTIEDPIEYHMPRINQSQIQPRVGYTFATGLRAFLRQDPDIIMVGEIRDAETAEISAHAALTGHLVLSTLHTNDAPTALPRLLDMGVPSFLVAFTANLIMAQRLVRKICPFCKKEYKLTAENITDLEKIVDAKKMIELFKKHDCLKSGDTTLKSWTFYRGEGCQKCNREGYKGRLGIYETLEVNKTIAELINKKASVEELRQGAIKNGFTTMLQDGIIKAKLGLTSLEEVLEATRD